MIPAIGKAVLGKIAMSVFDKRKKSGGSACAQMKTPKVSVVLFEEAPLSVDTKLITVSTDVSGTINVVYTID